MFVFSCVLAKGDEILSNVAHVVICAAIYYVSTGDLIARDV